MTSPCMKQAHYKNAMILIGAMGMLS